MTQRAIIATHGITARIFGCALSRMIRRLQAHYALWASFFVSGRGEVTRRRSCVNQRGCMINES